MFHRRVVLRFIQLDSEPFYNAWWRFKNLLDKFPLHGFSMEEKLNIFLNGLSDDIRNWVGQEDGNTSFYQRSVEEAYLMFDDLAKFYYWNCSMSNSYYENNSIYSEPEN